MPRSGRAETATIHIFAYFEPNIKRTIYAFMISVSPYHKFAYLGRRGQFSYKIRKVRGYANPCSMLTAGLMIKIKMPINRVHMQLALLITYTKSAPPWPPSRSAPFRVYFSWFPWDPDNLLAPASSCDRKNKPQLPGSAAPGPCSHFTSETCQRTAGRP